MEKKDSAHPLFMSSTTSLSASRALLITGLLLFDISRLASAQLITYKTQPECPPFSCGALHDVRYPFRSKDDHRMCGDRRFQLLCVDGNKTIWDIHQPGTYYVTEIPKTPYSVYYPYDNFRVVDARWADGNCSLPLQSLSRTSIEKAGFDARFFWWATFVSCTRRTESKGYSFVPCLSKTDRDAFVYVVFSWGPIQLDNAERFCSFLAMTPITPAPEQVEQMNGDVFQILKVGFPVPIYADLPESSIGDCLKNAAK